VNRGWWAQFHPNARICLALEPLWAVFGGAVLYFAPLYMKALGVDELGMGALNSLGMFLAFVFYALAGPITNKLGRRWTSLIFDLLSWSVSMVLWAFAQNFIWFLAAAVFNSMIKVVFVSWNLLMTEDSPEEQRAKIYLVVNVISTFGGFVTLGAGFLLDQFGTVPVMRVAYLAGAILMTSMFLLRHRIAKETENGVLQKARTKDRTLVSLVRAQFGHLGLALKGPRFLLLGGLFLVVSAAGSFSFYQILYLTGNLGYRASELAWAPAVNSVMSVVLALGVLPRLSQKSGGGLVLGFLLATVGFTAFLFLGPQGLVWVLVVQGLSSAAGLIQSTYMTAVFMNAVEEEHRADLFGMVQMATMALSIPTGILAGALYTVSPLATFGTGAGLMALGLVLSWILVRLPAESPPQEVPRG